MRCLSNSFPFDSDKIFIFRHLVSVICCCSLLSGRIFLAFLKTQKNTKNKKNKNRESLFLLLIKETLFSVVCSFSTLCSYVTTCDDIVKSISLSGPKKKKNQRRNVGSKFAIIANKTQRTLKNYQK